MSKLCGTSSFVSEKFLRDGKAAGTLSTNGTFIPYRRIRLFTVNTLPKTLRNMTETEKQASADSPTGSGSSSSSFSSSSSLKFNDERKRRQPITTTLWSVMISAMAYGLILDITKNNRYSQNIFGGPIHECILHYYVKTTFFSFPLYLTFQCPILFIPLTFWHVFLVRLLCYYHISILNVFP